MFRFLYGRARFLTIEENSNCHNFNIGEFSLLILPFPTKGTKNTSVQDGRCLKKTGALFYEYDYLGLGEVVIIPGLSETGDVRINAPPGVVKGFPLLLSFSFLL